MSRLSAIAWSAVFLVIAPGTVAVLVPWWISRWRVQSGPPSLRPLRAVGIAFIFAGSAVLFDSFPRFALRGGGTPAPPLAPRHLVVSGFYRYVRNPMYLAAISVIAGQGFLLSDLRLLEYGSVVWRGFHLFVWLYEEPALRATFGGPYEGILIACSPLATSRAPTAGKVKLSGAAG
jgi:protein-S-isoprenylcysteine O-methyltransferase Ste14